MTEAVIRRATAVDAEILADLGARTFAATFGHLYPPEDLAAFLRRAYDLEHTREQLADPGVAAWLLEVNGDAVGHALAGPCGLPHPDVTAACGELKRLYILPSWQGGGRGSRLLEAALAWLDMEKTGALWIGVWSQNLAAQRLYGRLGFAKVGEYLFEVGSVRDHEFILRRG
jgi:GNAT superfamily N-acetyltransferase